MAIPLADAAATEVAITAEADLIRVRQLLRTEAQQAGLGLVDETKFVTAGSELARNILTYATGSQGRLRVEQVQRAGRRGVRATFSDSGPGIADIAAAFTDGYSTSGSVGLGLPGARRLVDWLELTSGAEGTTVVIVKWAR